MWKHYIRGQLRQGRSAVLSVAAASFVSALLLALVCTLFYNLWRYDIQTVEHTEGPWHARLCGDLPAEALATLQNHLNVEWVEIDPELSGPGQTVVEIRLRHPTKALTDLPALAALAGLGPEAIQYHHALLALYLVHDPLDPAPRLLLPFYGGILALTCLSLVLVIHNAFAVTMEEQVRQLGILSSIGATPAQLRACLLQQTALLCAIPLAVGTALGTAASAAVLAQINAIAADVPGRLNAVWQYHPLVLAGTLLAAGGTVGVSAWLPAHRLSRQTPLQAIRSGTEPALVRKKRSLLLGRLFGEEGTLAGNALHAQRKALRTTTLSLTFSFLAFTLMLCFFTLSQISTEMTYFERYQDAWDVMVTVKNTALEDFAELDALRALPEVREAAAYQKAAAKRLLGEAELEGPVRELLETAPASAVTRTETGWQIDAPLMILDDDTFLEYCAQIGVPARLDGVVVLDRIWDSAHSNFRERIWLPYVRQTGVSCLNERELPVLAYTQTVPNLREEYWESNDYELVHFVPQSLWRSAGLGNAEPDMFVRVLARPGLTLPAMNALEDAIQTRLADRYTAESENRLQEKATNDEMIDGMMWVFGAFCVLLAIIGIANVFTNTLGFVRGRRREFARYQSVGVTPAGLCKIFCIEALVIAGRPVLVTAPLAAASLWAMMRASYLDPALFWRRAPVGPVLTFLLGIFAFVSLAYWLGARRLLAEDLAETLRDDALL